MNEEANTKRWETLFSNLKKSLRAINFPQKCRNRRCINQLESTLKFILFSAKTKYWRWLSKKSRFCLENKEEKGETRIA